MNKKIITAVMIGLIGAGSAFAYLGNPNVMGPNFDNERHEEMQKAFVTEDYNLWNSLMGERRGHRVTDIINENNFDVFIEMREARLNGDEETSNKLRAELGLGLGRGFQRGKENEQRNENENRLNRGFGSNCPFLD